MSKANYFTQCLIEIDGKGAPQGFMNALAEVVVDTSLHMPDMFSILLHDSSLTWVDAELVDVGKRVKIGVQTGQAQGAYAGSLIEGEITALEPTFSVDGKTTCLVRGYDKSHRLHRGKKTRTFTRQSDDEIVRKIAGEAGLSAQVDGTGIVYDYVFQNNQTNMEFLLARAERIGYQVYVAGEKLYFKKGDTSQGNGPTLAFGDALRSFRPRLTTTHQADKVVVKGWDAKGKQAITAQTVPGANLKQGGLTRTGGDTARGAFGAAEAVVVDRPVFTVDEAQALATGLSNDMGREFVQAEGTCLGHPGVKAGWTITIEGVGKRFSGAYFVTRATHVYNEQGYETTFDISGRQPNTLGHLLRAGNGHDGRARGLVRGVVTGLVTNLNDPDKLGRVKVKYDWLGNVESDWVRIAAPMAGAGRGFYCLPEVNDEVLLAFEQGDVHHPYVVGVLWSSKDRPPKPNDQVVGSGKVNERMLVSRSGHVIILDDSAGKEQIVIRSVGSLSIQSQADLTLEAAGQLTIQGHNVAIDGGPKTTVKGGTIELN